MREAKLKLKSRFNEISKVIVKKFTREFEYQYDK